MDGNVETQHVQPVNKELPVLFPSVAGQQVRWVSQRMHKMRMMSVQNVHKELKENLLDAIDSVGLLVRLVRTTMEDAREVDRKVLGKLVNMERRKRRREVDQRMESRPEKN
eukprot:TRINITY_DN10548_c0_g1_i1.p1 TRINITY_DN10548_c0_g1~~TRINITY_DN10548_c0_g1_i1.p1  ORF type:complete len:123 (+),score=9.56 TRINITY_DN10548_c0_g1_i1:37-369(+)